MGHIRVTNVGKAYKIYSTRFGRLKEWLSWWDNKQHVLKWIIQGVDFEVQPGEAVGIIGLNGAGKSTLLKMITGTTRPTNGTIAMTGRVAALLELGMGFHPDFTGRQNVFMSGQLLGYSTEELSQLMPSIEEFAEIGNAIDEPVRTYSSGMQMRLAFSVATATRPDVLIVDEALSVGDAYFQHKSFDRIRSFSKQGTTLLIVSHDKQAIQSVCDRAILLNDGKVAMQGNPEAVMDFYNAMLADKEGATVHQIENASGKQQTISGTGEIIIDEVSLLNAKNEAIEIIKVGDSVAIKVLLHAQEYVDNLVVGYLIKDRVGQAIFGTNTYHLEHDIRNVAKGTKLELRFKFAANLGEGTYSVAIAAHGAATHIGKNYEWRDLALVFNVINATKFHFVGTTWLPPILERTK